jgi:MFS family permease
VPVVAAPDLERSFDTTHSTLAIVVFLVPGVIGFVVEPYLFLLADRYPRRWFMRAGVAGMAVASFVAAAAPGPVTLALAIGASGIASGVAVSLAQATLVDRTPDARGRTLARWTLVSAIGDLAAPVLLAALALAGADWRLAYALVGALLVVWLVMMFADRDDGRVQREDSPPLLAALKETLRDKTLVAWLFGAALCDLLDEILVVFASLHVRLDLGAGVVWQSAIVAAFILGEIASLVILDKLLASRSEWRLLVIAAIGCAVTYALWLASPTPLAALVLAIPAGAFIAPLYPLSAAQAYARRPDASGSVLAAGHLFTPFGLALPWAIGALADHAGLFAALLLLVVQPLGLVVIVLCTRGVARSGG